MSRAYIQNLGIYPIWSGVVGEVDESRIASLGLSVLPCSPPGVIRGPDPQRGRAASFLPPVFPMCMCHPLMTSVRYADADLVIAHLGGLSGALGKSIADSIEPTNQRGIRRPRERYVPARRGMSARVNRPVTTRVDSGLSPKLPSRNRQMRKSWATGGWLAKSRRRTSPQYPA